MPATFGIFLSAAVILALTPGPGIFYVLTRSLKGGRGEGIASACGTAIGGMFHVAAAALGISAILMTSALAFSVVKYLGAAYLIYLGIRTLLRKTDPVGLVEVREQHTRQAFFQGITTEILNPKTALFFLAFIPQFVDPAGPVFLQFVLLGCISVILNTSVDFVVASLAGPIGKWLHENERFRAGQQMVSGWVLIGLGAYVATASSDQKR